MYQALLLASLGFLASASETFKHFDCGTHQGHATEEFLSTVSSLHSDHVNGSRAARRRAALVRIRQAVPISVPTYFHIVTTAASQGQITQLMANDQIAAMNTAYAPYNIQFALENVSFTVNDAWAVGAGSDDTAMKTALRQGTYSALNIYFQTNLTGDILGICTLPSSIGNAPVDPSTYVADGCNIQANTMPKGTIEGYNQGMTAVHETGHWMGLLHTFEGYSCDGDGDYIADTPQQSTSTDGCPVSPPKDSCSQVAGLDPIHNYMDYSNDACYTSFTPLQQDRMQTMWNMFRAGN